MWVVTMLVNTRCYQIAIKSITSDLSEYLMDFELPLSLFAVSLFPFS
jgi:hypothetical protein